MNAIGFSQKPVAELQAIFNVLPGAYVLLSPTLQVEAVSTSYQAAVPAAWPALQPGQYLPAVLEAVPAVQCLARKLCNSLKQVCVTGQPHQVACGCASQSARLAAPGTPGTWQFYSQPVRDAQGVVRHILCQAATPVPPATHAPRVAVADPLATALVAPCSPISVGSEAVALCLLVGPSYLIELFNPLAARLWGQPAAQVLGQPFLEASLRLDVANYTAACAAVWQSGQAVSWPEMPMAVAAEPASSLELGYFNLSFQPFRTESGHLKGILLLAQEVTPLLQARQQVRQLQAELAATTAGLADYVAELTKTAAGSVQQ